MKRIYKTSFDAAHFIKDHPKCGQRHNHQYKLKVTLNSSEEWLDFHVIRERIEKALADIGIVDHTENWLGHKTCEKLAEDIYRAVLKMCHDLKLNNVKVELYETEHFGVEYP